MNSNNFFQKNKKVLMAAVGLIVICIVMLSWRIGKRTAGKSLDTVGESQRESIVEEPTETTSVEENSVEIASDEVTTVADASTEELESPAESEPVLTAEYELIYEGISVFDVFHYSAFKEDNNADLYMRRLKDDKGEYVELSLWADQKEIWHTVNDDDTEDYDLFYMEPSECLTLEQKQCYYVLPLDGAVYLMRYRMETMPHAVTMSYKVFGVDSMLPNSFSGSEEPVDAGSITAYLADNGKVDTEVSFPVEQLTDFADTVKTYMENGYLAASTLQGVFEFGSSDDMENTVSPYLYDIFPWISEIIAKNGVNTEGISSVKQMLTAVKDALPTDGSVTMPDVAANGTGFITGDYFSDSDESYLTINMVEEGSYSGHLLIDNVLSAEFSGDYANGILNAVQQDNNSEGLLYELEISFQSGRVIVTITAADREDLAGETITLDKNVKPKSLEVMKNDSDTAQNNLDELYSSTVKCDYTWLTIDDEYIDRSLPAIAVLENGSVITFNYDDMYRLCSLEKDGEEYAVFSWKYDTQSGKSILREYCIDDLQYEYTDLVVAENSLYGKYENIARYAYVTKAADDSFDITYDYETGEEGRIAWIIEEGKQIAKIEYIKNTPFKYWNNNGEWILMEDIDETELEEKERELFISVRSDCRYLDGVIYIPDLMIYYYPDRGFVDVNGSRILKSNYGIISGEGAAKKSYHSYGDMQLSKTLYGKYRLVEGKLKNGDTIELEYIENPSKDNFVSAKKVNGVVTTRYIWQADNEMGHYLIKKIVDKDVEVEYLYGEYVLGNSYKYNIVPYGFIYDGEVYVYGDDGMGIYHNGVKILSREMHFERGTPSDYFPKEVDVWAAYEQYIYLYEYDMYMDREGALYYYSDGGLENFSPEE